jgi:hypothetical protein
MTLSDGSDLDPDLMTFDPDSGNLTISTNSLDYVGTITVILIGTI